MRLFITVLLISFIMASPIYAQSKTAQKLETIKKKLQSEKAKQKKLDKERQAIKSEIKKFQSETITLAKDLQEKESNLNSLSRQLNTLKEQQKQLSKDINTERKDIIALLEILQRIALEPPSLILMQKQTYGMEVMNTALLVEGTVEIAQGKIARFTKKKADLDDIKNRTEQKTKEVASVTHKLKSEKTELDSILSKKKQAEDKIASEASKTRERIKKLAKESNNLADLLKKLMAEKKKVAGDAPTTKSKTPAPVRGIKVTRFGQKNKGGITAKGLTLKAASKASVISPYNGRVLFSGPFKKYDNLMIIEHPKGYHSVIAGITTPFVTEGKSILAGEPIGRLDSNGKVYLELRYKNKPIDPEDYFIVKS
ncbi:MAG: peptidoglycan DD-metalloendopeptidase family protein [Alphaproteobacteria bacterium]|nr:peptidoglycan DD-metalloendopeptidase family protein [Alphaproteobacteria bacterium]